MSRAGAAAAAPPDPATTVLPPGAVAHLDLDERVRFASAAYAAALGSTDRELRGRQLEDVLGPEAYARVRPVVAAALAGRGGMTEGPPRGPGGTRGATWTAYLPDTDAGGVHGVVALVLDRPLLPLAALATASDALDVLQERQRIAADLHDTVLQRLYAAGLALTRALVTTDPGTDSPFLAAIEEIDGAIVELRAAIVGVAGDLQDAETASSLDRIVGHAARAFGFAPDLEVEGSLESIPAPVARHLLAVLNEALSNVVRHAEARRVGVVVTVSATDVALRVTDDGVGVGDSGRRSGVENMRQRAELLGGTFGLLPRAGGGTTLSWSAPMGAR